jgi:uncharacterized membrane protein YkgB
MIKSNEDRYLFSLIEQGNKDALVKLFEKYYGHLSRLAFCLTKNRKIADDIVIDFFTMIWENREILDYDKPVSYYLFTLTYSKGDIYGKQFSAFSILLIQNFNTMQKLVSFLANSQSYFINLTRIAIFIVMAWIGGLKAFQYEADGIVPFVSNSPLMSFFYTKKAHEYKNYKNPEGQTVQKNINWHRENGTYIFAYGLGTVILIIGTMTLLGIWFAKIGIIGGLMTFGMSLVTLSFLITTPEVYVPNLGGDFATPQHGFPYLSGVGRLVIKDIIMMTAGLICASDSAKYLTKSVYWRKYNE